jgi:hypothetical protein
MRRVERWMGIIVSRVARRVVDGKAPHPGWLPRRWLTVVSGDVDRGGGIGAVWLVWRPGSAEAETRTALMERCGGRGSTRAVVVRQVVMWPRGGRRRASPGRSA